MEDAIQEIYKSLHDNIEDIVNDLSNSLVVELNKERDSKEYVYKMSEDRLKKKIKKILINKYKKVLKEIFKTIGNIRKELKNKKYSYDEKVLDVLVDNASKSIELQFNRMGNNVLAIMKSEQIQIRRHSKKHNVSIKESHKNLKSSLFNTPEFYFRDKSGRKWNLSSYFKMLINSLVYNVSREIVIEQAIANNIDSVLILPTNKIINTDQYEDLKIKMFHPNSKKLLKLMES